MSRPAWSPSYRQEWEEKEKSVKDGEGPEATRGTEVRRSSRQEGREVGGGHVFQGNPKVGQLKLGNKNEIRESLALLFCSKIISLNQVLKGI